MAEPTNNATFHSQSNAGYQFGQVRDSTINIGQLRDPDETKFLRSLSSDYRRWKDNNPKRVQGTCRWLLDDPRFQQWRATDHSSLLHVLAGPGCGKSVLARSLVDESLASREGKQTVTLYFFFKSGNEAQESHTAAIKAIMHQFYQQTSNAGLAKYAIPMYKAYGSNLESMFAELWDIFLSSIKKVSRKDIICVIDALDECQKADRYSLMESISEYVSRSAGNPGMKPVKVIVTSRPYPDSEFNDPEFLHHHSFVRFDGTDKSSIIAEEINRVIEIKVPRLIPKLALSTQQAIVEQLQSMNNRTYLWLYLVLDYVKERIFLNSTERKLRSLLKQLPPTVDQAYNAMLERSLHPGMTKVLLSIALVATRPLSLEEASFAFEFAQNSYERVDGVDCHSAEQFEDALKELCGLLLTVHESKIYFLHETVREFLLNVKKTLSESILTWKGSINLESANLLMANLCTSYLCLKDFNSMAPPLFQTEYHRTHKMNVYKGTPTEILQWAKQKVFLMYAAHNWTEHFRAVESHHRLQFNSPEWQLCVDTSTAYRVWSAVKDAEGAFKIYNSDTNDFLVEFTTDLRTFTKIGLLTAVEKLLQHGTDINRASTRGETALHISCREGFQQITRLLCEYGADVNATDHHSNHSPLHCAVENGEAQITQILLQKGANVHIQDLSGYSALHMACKYPSIFDSLAQHEGDLDVQGGIRQLPHHRASTYGCGPNVRSHGTGVEADARNDDRKTQAYTSSEVDQKAIIHLLLEHGAEIDVQDGAGETPLHISSRGGHKLIVQTLLDRGAEIDFQNELGSTPLHLSSDNGHESIVQVLLDKGAKILTDIRGMSPLHLSSQAGHERIVQMLLDIGAGVNMQGIGRKTPLHLSSREGHEQVVQMLLNRGAEIDMRDDDGMTPLHYASGSNYEPVVRILLEKGADVNARDCEQVTPLHWASERDGEPIVRILLEKGAEINARTDNGMTPLHFALTKDRKPTVRTLLEKGADVNAQDFNNKSPLHYAVRMCEKLTIQMLLEKGADTNAQDSKGKTPLHYASIADTAQIRNLTKYQQFIQVLFENGADVSIQDSEGNEPLQYASREPTIQMLLEYTNK